MTIALPPERAAERLCPLARTFAASKAEPGCRGPSCAPWRWTIGGPWKAAVQKLAAQTGEKVPYPKAARAVADDPAAFGLHGYCGMGGQP